jgi:hypothetical protein
MAGRGLDDGGKVIPLVAPHRPDYRKFIDDLADVREPVRYRNARLSVPFESPEYGNHWPLHFRDIVPEADGIDQLALRTCCPSDRKYRYG